MSQFIIGHPLDKIAAEELATTVCHWQHTFDEPVGCDIFGIDTPHPVLAVPDGTAMTADLCLKDKGIPHHQSTKLIT